MSSTLKTTLRATVNIKPRTHTVSQQSVTLVTQWSGYDVLLQDNLAPNNKGTRQLSETTHKLRTREDEDNWHKKHNNYRKKELRQKHYGTRNGVLRKSLPRQHGRVQSTTLTKTLRWMTPAFPFFILASWGLTGRCQWGRETDFVGSATAAGIAHLAVGASATGTSRRPTAGRESPASLFHGIPVPALCVSEHRRTQRGPGSAWLCLTHAPLPGLSSSSPPSPLMCRSCCARPFGVSHRRLASHPRAGWEEIGVNRLFATLVPGGGPRRSKPGSEPCMSKFVLEEDESLQDLAVWFRERCATAAGYEVLLAESRAAWAVRWCRKLEDKGEANTSEVEKGLAASSPCRSCCARSLGRLASMHMHL